jgi:hypothetical protein
VVFGWFFFLKKITKSLPACDKVFSFGAVFLPVFCNLDSFLQNMSSVNAQSMLHQKRKKEKKTLDPSVGLVSTFEDCHPGSGMGDFLGFIPGSYFVLGTFKP